MGVATFAAGCARGSSLMTATGGSNGSTITTRMCSNALRRTLWKSWPLRCMRALRTGAGPKAFELGLKSFAGCRVGAGWRRSFRFGLSQGLDLTSIVGSRGDVTRCSVLRRGVRKTVFAACTTRYQRSEIRGQPSNTLALQTACMCATATTGIMHFQPLPARAHHTKANNRKGLGEALCFQESLIQFLRCWQFP